MLRKGAAPRPYREPQPVGQSLFLWPGRAAGLRAGVPAAALRLSGGQQGRKPEQLGRVLPGQVLLRGLGYAAGLRTGPRIPGADGLGILGRQLYAGDHVCPRSGRPTGHQTGRGVSAKGRGPSGTPGGTAQV